MALQPIATFATPGFPLTQDAGPGMTSLHPQDFIGAVKDEWQLFSDRALDYTVGEPIGFGASSIVYTALWKPADEPESQPIPCALKVLDLDSLPPRSLQLLQRETTLMSLSKHPNVLRVRGSWMDGHRLFIALRLMNKGSAADVMRYGWPGGMEEEVIKCILRQALKGLNYLHVNGFIHRDIKAANLLIDDDGTVLLGDLGVAADLSEDPQHHQSSTSSRSKSSTITATAALSQPRALTAAIQGGAARKEDSSSPSRPPIGKRKSFVGTPCWMAPELIQGKQYDASADIWSFAITALELCQGHPPRFRESPQKVLLRTLQEAPPTLNREGSTFKYTRAFKDMVDSCLVKDPSKRPTAEQLLQTPFFRSAKKKSYIVNAILKDLPPLVQRQERRMLAQATSPNTIDSWDFSTTVHSPATSNFRYRALEELVAAEESGGLDVSDGAVFEMEGEDTSHSRSSGAITFNPQKRSSQTTHHPEFEYDTEPEGDDKISTELSSTESGSEISRSLTSDTSATSSSFVAGSLPAEKVLEAAASPPAISRNNQSDSSQSPPPPSNPEASQSSNQQHMASHNTSPALSEAVSIPTKLMNSATSESDFRKRDKPSTGIWKKLKSNLKIPSSSSSPTQHDEGRGSPEKSRLGGLLASASRGTIGRSNKGNPEK